MKSLHLPGLALLFAGIGIITLAQVVPHYTDSPDLVSGALHGFGIGLLLVSLYLNRGKMSVQRGG